MIKKILKTISLLLLATQGGAIGASETSLPELPISPHCKDYFKTSGERASAILCLSNKLDDLDKAIAESRRRLDETEPQVNTEFERGFRKDSHKALDSTDQFSIFIRKKCKSLLKEVPKDCLDEFSQMLTDANANANTPPHSGL